MKIILDENLPRGLKRYLSAYEVTTVQEQGWAGFKNGELMTRIDGV
jgi:predicted nuclease of predicted toxin-antitoxin system